MRLRVRSYLSSSVTWLSAIRASGERLAQASGLLPASGDVASTAKYGGTTTVAILTNQLATALRRLQADRSESCRLTGGAAIWRTAAGKRGAIRQSIRRGRPSAS